MLAAATPRASVVTVPIRMRLGSRPARRRLRRPPDTHHHLDASRARTAPAAKAATTWEGADTALSPREWEVAWLVARGHTNRQIAAHLFLGEKTVERHLSRIFGKLEITARASLATYVTQRSAIAAAAITRSKSEPVAAA
jgi:DNA-binding NarL/FixJ family response regulator